MASLDGKKIVLGVTGGISAYKAAELCRLLRKAGATVNVVMTRAATEFITPLTLQTLSGNPVAQGLFDPAHEATIGHIRLADEADVVVIAPATADAIARLAAGMADDLLAAVVLATRAPVLLAPAMNVNMWENPLTQANLGRLLAGGQVTTVGPDAGELACGWIGAGRLVDPAEIVTAVAALCSQPLAGRTVVVSAGPTHEAIDDVRFVGNRSSGKMGFAMATAAARLGARVVLIAGPVSLPTPAGIARRIDVESAQQMHDAVLAALADADVVVMAAAVADFRPAQRESGKLSRRRNAAPALALVANPDVLADLARSAQARVGARPFLVGFAAEVGGDALADRARKKMIEKKCDAMVANDISRDGIGFGGDRNAVTLVTRSGPAIELGLAPKDAIARDLWMHLVPLLPSRAGAPPVVAARTRHLRVT